jgi:hypothetical protein
MGIHGNRSRNILFNQFVSSDEDVLVTSLH